MDVNHEWIIETLDAEREAGLTHCNIDIAEQPLQELVAMVAFGLHQAADNMIAARFGHDLPVIWNNPSDLKELHEAVAEASLTIDGAQENVIALWRQLCRMYPDQAEVGWLVTGLSERLGTDAGASSERPGAATP